MARFKRGAKAQAIREALEKTPEAPAKDVVAAIGEKGLKVTPQMVYSMKARLANGPKKAGRGKRKGGVRGFTSTVGNGFTIDTLILAKKLADQLGGVEKAKEAMDALSKLQ